MLSLLHVRMIPLQTRVSTDAMLMPQTSACAADVNHIHELLRSCAGSSMF
jgi:hypothetical protein